MSAQQTNAFDASALQLVAALDRYAEDSADMVAHGPDLDRYRNVSAQIEQIRSHASSLPAVRAHWVQLLISHSELVHLMWRVQYGEDGVTPEQVADVRGKHADAIAALRERCLRVMTPDLRFALLADELGRATAGFLWGFAPRSYSRA